MRPWRHRASRPPAHFQLGNRSCDGAKVEGGAKFDALPDLVGRDGIAVVAEAPHARASMRRALRLLSPVLRSLAVVQEHDLWGYPAVRVDDRLQLHEPNEAWLAQPPCGSFSALSRGDFGELLREARVAHDPRVSRAAVVLARQVELVSAGARPHALVGYEAERVGEFVAVYLCRNPRGGLWLSRVPLTAFLRIASTLEGRLRDSFEVMLEEVYWFAPYLDADGRLGDFVFLDVNARAAQGVRLPWERLVGRRLNQLFPAYRQEGLFDRYRDAFLNERTVEARLELPDASGGAVFHQRFGHIEGELVVFSARVDGSAEEPTSPRGSASSMTDETSIVSPQAYASDIGVLLTDIGRATALLEGGPPLDTAGQRAVAELRRALHQARDWVTKASEGSGLDDEPGESGAAEVAETARLRRK